MNEVCLHGTIFEQYISNAQIKSAIQGLSIRLNTDYRNRNPLFLVVLNGAFLFAANLIQTLDIELEVSFIKLSSYEGTASKGQVTELIGLQEACKGRSIVIIEDIVDTGLTIAAIIQSLQQQGAADIRVATLLFKPDAYKGKIDIDYVGLSIPSIFVVGYGLDYNGLGRNLPAIYIATNEPD
jgi:hypoxanthine phosphoribosyltransferase